MRKHIVVTGPESSGKTTLSKILAENLNAAWIPEYARGYLEAAKRRAILDDFPHLVVATDNLVQAGFQQQERRGNNPSIVIQDTSFEILSIWQADKFELTSLVDRAFNTGQPDVYLLCQPDLPWEYDPLREDPHRRQELFNRIKSMLENTGVPIVEVSGFGESRSEVALNSIQPFLR